MSGTQLNADDVYPARIEFRRAFNDVRVTDWQQIPDLTETSFAALRAYLSHEYGEDPQLERRDAWDRGIVMDRFDYQYRGVEHLNT